MTFAQRWKVATLSLVTGAGIVATLILVGIVLIVWKGGWSPAVEVLRVGILAKGLLTMAGLMALSMVGLLLAGPVSKLTARVGESEISADGD